MAVPLTPVQVPSQGNLPRVPGQSANYKDDNKIIHEVVGRNSGIYLTAEEKSGKRQLGDRLMKAVRPAIA